MSGRRRRLSREEVVRARSPWKRRAGMSGARREKNTGSPLADSCWHTLYASRGAFCIGSEMNERGLWLTRMSSEGAMWPV